MIEYIDQQNLIEILAVAFSLLVFLCVILIGWHVFTLSRGRDKKSNSSKDSLKNDLSDPSVAAQDDPNATASRFLTTSFGKVYIGEIGNKASAAPWIVLLHGWGASSLVWRFIETPLSSHFRVLSLDLPGFGQSNSPEPLTFNIDSQCKRLIEVFDLLNIDSAFLVGNSMGGALALWLAKQFPDRFEKVVTLNPAVSSRLIPIKIYNPKILEKFLKIGFNRYSLKWIYSRVVQRQDLLTDAYLKQVYDSYRSSPKIFTSLVSATNTLQDARLPQDLKGMKSSVLVLYGAKDRLIPSWAIDDLMKTLPHAVLKINSDGGHHLMEDEPVWVLEKLLEFLKV